MSSEVAIKVEGLGKRYNIYDKPRDRLKQLLVPRLQSLVGLPEKHYSREFWALREVSFAIQKGETIGVVGRNGSGKSTLLQVICGTTNATRGSVFVNGRVSALLELGSGFNPDFTGRENIYLNGSVLGFDRGEIDTRLDNILSFADIGEVVDQPIKTYSSGMVMRLAFAVAVNVDPDILIVDEALSVGDELFQRKCFSRIEKIKSRGSTIIFVSHSAAQIIELCDRCLLLDKGELILEGSPRETVGIYQKLLYAGEDRIKCLRDEIVLKRFSGRQIGDRTAPQNDQAYLATSSVDDVEETYDPGLVPASTIEYASHGPLIGMPVILSANGRLVNGLVRGRTYRYCYQVEFTRSCELVRFGMSLKSVTGLHLAGAYSAHDLSDSIDRVVEGDTYAVEFSFVCNLNPGVYYMNAGVFGVLDGAETVLHRRAEIIAFRVLPVHKNIETETVSLSIVPAVVRCE